MFHRSKGRKERHEERRSYFAHLPTSVPGIEFTGEGYLYFILNPTGPGAAVSREIAGASSLLEAHEIARKITSSLSPEDTFKAQQRIALDLVEWRDSAGYPGVRFRAEMKIILDSQNEAHIKKFQMARRAARLDEAISQDRIKFLREFALQDPATARLWWLDRNLSGSAPDTSWAMFDSVVSPLIAHADAQEDLAARISQIMVTTLDRISEGPDGLSRFGHAAAVALKAMGWPDLVKDIETPNGAD